jgi:hypothetical protein
VTFASGELTKTFTIYVSGDTAIEPDETFSVGLLNCVNCSFIKSNGIATILNDDYPKLSINNVSITEGNSGTKNLVFTITRASYSGTSSVTYSTSDGTAKTSDSDYTQVSNTLVFTGNQLQKTISIPILGDTKFESDETFNVSLSNCVGCTLPNNSGIGTITNDDKKK